MHPRSAKLGLSIMALLALAAPSPIGAGERLTMRVTPRMAVAPASLIVNTVAERDPANRALQIEVESPEYRRSSLVQIDGDEAPRTSTVRYDGVPGGTYEVRAILLGSGGKHLAATVLQIEVFSSVPQ